jgi:hypothetical protein
MLRAGDRRRVPRQRDHHGQAYQRTLLACNGPVPAVGGAHLLDDLARRGAGALAGHLVELAAPASTGMTAGPRRRRMFAGSMSG